MFEQLAHLLLLPGGLAGLGRRLPALGSAAAAWECGRGVSCDVADEGVQHRLGNFLDDVDEHRWGTSGHNSFSGSGYSSEPSVTPRTARPRTSSRALKSAKKRRMSFWVGSCSRTRKDRRMKAPVVDQREHAERAIVQLIDGDIAAEAGQCALEQIGVGTCRARLFFPRGLDPIWMVAQEQKRGGRRDKCQLAMR